MRALYFWRKIVSKTLIPAIAIAAILLSSLASAAVGSVGTGPRISVGSIGTVRVTTVPPRTPPRIQSKIQMLDCHTYERRNPYNDTVITRTICK